MTPYSQLPTIPMALVGLLFCGVAVFSISRRVWRRRRTAIGRGLGLYRTLFAAVLGPVLLVAAANAATVHQAPMTLTAAAVQTVLHDDGSTTERLVTTSGRAFTFVRAQGAADVAAGYTYRCTTREHVIGTPEIVSCTIVP